MKNSTVNIWNKWIFQNRIFIDSVENPANSVTKDMIATVLYLGYPSNATQLREKWKITEERANYLTQQVIWDLKGGELISDYVDKEYDYDLHYYAENEKKPIFR